MMKALSVKQPWAGFIADGGKTIETRTWPTSYRGDILVCSTLSPDKEIVDKLMESLLPPKRYRTLGVALCLVRLVDCLPFEKSHTLEAMCTLPGGYSWFLEEIRPVQQIPIRGQLGLFTLDPEITKQIIEL